MADGIEYELTREDAIALNYFAMRRQFGKATTVMPIMLVVVVVLGSMLTLLDGTDWITDTFVGPLLGVLVVALGVLLVVTVLAKRRLAAMSDAALGVFGTYRFEAHADGLHEESPSGPSVYPWATVREIVDQPEHVFLLGPKAAHVVPKRAIGPAELERFLESCRQLRA